MRRKLQFSKRREAVEGPLHNVVDTGMDIAFHASCKMAIFAVRIAQLRWKSGRFPRAILQIW